MALILLIIERSLNCLWQQSLQTLFMPIQTTHLVDWRPTMQWTTPAFTDLRFGFEITMYIANR